MRINIHRGTQEIGGTCIELRTDSTRILLDAGSPLKPESATLDVVDIKADAVIISHPHQDHYGLIDNLPPESPVYTGKLAKNLLDATRMFRGVALHTNNFQFYDKWQPFTIGNFRITPYLVDHSAVDAYAFLIEAEGKRVFYSGDFRGHGNKNKLFETILEHPPRNIDLLFLEGTMLQRDNHNFPDERSVQLKIREVIAKQENISFIISSSQNIDRLISAYKACTSSGKIFVIDFYTAWVLEQVKEVSKGIRALDWRHIAVYSSGPSSGWMYDKMKKNRNRLGGFINRVFEHTVKEADLRADPSRYLFLGKTGCHRLIDSFKSDKIIPLIYSQWLGYLNDDTGQDKNSAAINGLRTENVPGVEFIYAHTSGHAPLEDLQAFAAALSPKALVPIHTEFAYLYENHFANVLQLEDGKPYEI